MAFCRGETIVFEALNLDAICEGLEHRWHSVEAKRLIFIVFPKWPNCSRVKRISNGTTVNSVLFGRAETKRFAREWNDFSILTRKMGASIVKYGVFEHRCRSVETKWPLLDKMGISPRPGTGSRIKCRDFTSFLKKSAVRIGFTGDGSGQGSRAGL